MCVRVCVVATLSHFPVNIIMATVGGFGVYSWVMVEINICMWGSTDEYQGRIREEGMQLTISPTCEQKLHSIYL